MTQLTTPRLVASVGLIALLGALSAPPLLAMTWRVVPEKSILAVVTHKGGVGKGLAHNHLVVASGYRAQLSFDPAAVDQASFQFEALVAQLLIDVPELQQLWYPRLAQLGILDQPFAALSAGNQAKVQKAMLSDKQLAGEQFPQLGARLLALAPGTAKVGDTDFSHTATLELTVRGKSVQKPLAVRFTATDAALSIEAVGTFRFTDFGIEPYSAMLGAVKNQDEFHVFVQLAATPEI